MIIIARIFTIVVVMFILSCVTPYHARCWNNGKSILDETISYNIALDEWYDINGNKVVLPKGTRCQFSRINRIR